VANEEGAIRIDLTGVSVGFEPVEAGYYAATVYNVRQKLSKASQQPMLEVQFSITEPAEFAGRRLFTNYSLQPQALWKLKGFLQALPTGQDLDGAIDLSPEDLMGLPCVLVVAVGESPDGSPNNSVTRVLPDDGSVAIGAGTEEGFDLGF